MKVSVSSQLMKNYEAGDPVSGSFEIATARDKDGEILLFSIGDDRRLYCSKKGAGTETGWRRVDLSADLGEGFEVLHIATAQGQDGAPILAAVACHTTLRSRPRVYFTKSFSFEPTPDRWVFRGERDGIEITRIATGEDKRGQVLIVVSTQRGREMSTFLLNPDLSDQSWLWKEVPLPLNGQGVADLAIGHLASLERLNGVDAILYSLLRVDGKSTKVILTSLPDFTYYNHLVPIDFSPTALGLIRGQGGESELFLANKNLYRLSPKAQQTRSASELSEASLRLNARSMPYSAKRLIAGRCSDGSLEAFALSEDGALYYSFAQGDIFTEPCPLYKGFGQLTALRDPLTDVLDLFAVDINDRLHHLWQDLGTSRWKDEVMVLEALESTLEVDTYVSQVIFTDEDGAPLVGQSVKVLASELTLAEINGKKYFIDPAENVALCQTDALGAITVTTHAEGLVSPLLCVEADILDKALQINPNVVVNEKLSSLSVDDLKNARMQTDTDGVTEPLIKDPKAVDLSGAQQAVQELVKLQSELPSQSESINATVEAKAQGISIKSKGSKPSSRLDASKLPDGYAWGLDLTRKSPVFTKEKEKLKSYTANRKNVNKISLGGITSAAIDEFGSLFRSLTQGFQKATHMLVEKVEEGLQITINFVEDTVKVLVEYAEQVLEIVEFVFQQIGVFFKDLIRWLGFLFKWQDILRTKKVIKNNINQSLEYCIKQISAQKQNVQELFRKLEQGFITPAKDTTGQSSSTKMKSAGKDSSFFSSSSPEVNWALNLLSSGKLFGAKLPKIKLNESDFTKIVASFGTMAVEAIEDALNQVATEMVDAFETLSFEEAFQKALAAMSKALLDAAEGAALLMLDAEVLLLSALKSIFTARIKVPLLSPLYELISGDKLELSILDVISLLAAIVATVVYKIDTGKQPYPESEADKLGGAKSYEAFMKELTGESLPPLPSSSEVAAEPKANEKKNDFTEKEKASAAIAFEICAFRAVSAIIQTLKIPKLDKDPLTRCIKLGATFGTFALSLTTACINYTADRSNKRVILELSLTTFQSVFFIKECFEIGYMIVKGKVDLPDEIKTKLAWAESAIGVILLGGLAGIVALEAQEVEAKTGDEKKEGIYSLSLKAGQNGCNFTSRLISGLANDEKRRTKIATVQAALSWSTFFLNTLRAFDSINHKLLYVDDGS